MKYWILTALLTAALLTGGCDKILQIPEHPLDEYGLPEYSEKGRGTLACLVNGEPWIAERKGGLYRSPTGTIDISSAFLQGGGRIKNNNNGPTTANDIKLKLNPIYPERIYYLMSDTIYGGGGYFDNSICNDFYDMEIDYDKNWIDITHFDVDDGIISGLYEFKLVNFRDTTCRDTFHLTQGRFDLKIQYID